MKNQSRLYKSIAICASVIAALAMLVPTVTSAVGSSASSDSNHNAASDSSSATSTPSVTSTRSSSSDGSTVSSSSQSRSSDADPQPLTWTTDSDRNLKWGLSGENNSVLHLQANNSNDSVDASNLENLLDDYRYKSVKKVVIGGTDFKINNAENMFSDFSSLESVEGLQKIKFVKKDGKAVNIFKMFYKCGNLLSLTGLENWNMENVEDASLMFAYCKKLESIDLSKWQKVNISNVSYMFNKCTGLNLIKLFASKEGKLKKLAGVFDMGYNDFSSKLEGIEGLENWNTKNVVTMEEMFQNTYHLRAINGIENWDTAKVNNMSAMFRGSGVETLDLSKWSFYKGRSFNEQSDVVVSTDVTFDSLGLRDISFPVDKNKRPSVRLYGSEDDNLYEIIDQDGKVSIPFVSNMDPGIWRRFKGKTGKVPGENIISGSADDSKYIRIVRDYIKVTFNRAEYGSVTCAVDVLQGKNKTYNLNNAKLFDCVHNDSNSSSINDDKENDKKISAKELGEKREELAKYAESIGLNYTAKLIRNSKSSSLSALKNLLKEAESSRSAPMTFDQVKAVLGIDKKDTVVWNIDRLIPYDFIKKGYNNAYVQSTRSSSRSALVQPSFQQFVSNELVVQTSLKAFADTVFTAIVTRSSKKTEPRPCIPQIINPAPQPAPTPLPEPKQELKPDSTTDLGGFNGFGGKPAIPNKTPGQSKCICPNAQENKLNKSDDSSSDGVRRGYLITTGTAATCWIISSIAALFAGFFAGLAIATRKFAAR